jgi:hypothetical protein
VGKRGVPILLSVTDTPKGGRLQELWRVKRGTWFLAEHLNGVLAQPGGNREKKENREAKQESKGRRGSQFPRSETVYKINNFKEIALRNGETPEQREVFKKDTLVSNL